MEAEKRRFVGIDLGKREYTMAIIGRNGKMKIHQGKTSIAGRQALYGKLEKSDKVALEAGNLAFIMAREIMGRAGSEVRVLNSVVAQKCLSSNLPSVPDCGYTIYPEFPHEKLTYTRARNTKGDKYVTLFFG